MLPSCGQAEYKQISNFFYNPKSMIGEGAFGKVYKGQNSTSGEVVAIKKMDYAVFENDEYLKQAIKNEIAILKQFNHPNIVRFIDLVTTERSIYLITEFCEDGDLRDYLRRKVLSEREVENKLFLFNKAVSLMIQLVMGFKELEKTGVIHRDLKPANILTHRGTVKIADFGLAKYVDNYGSSMLRSCVGSPLYMAPQVLMKKTYTTKCDIWSLGVLYFEMLSKEFPFNGRTEQELLKNIQNNKFQLKSSIQVSKFSEEFLKKSLVVDEQQRMGWSELFQMFDEQERILNGAQQLKESYNFNRQVTEQVVQQPNWLKQPLYSDASFQQFRNILNLRQDLQFRSFVAIELFSNLNLCKQFIKKELQLEKFILVLGRSINLQYKSLSQQLDQLFQQAEFNSLRKQACLLQLSVRKECDFSLNHLQDTTELMEVLGIMQNMLAAEDFQKIFELEIKDPWNIDVEIKIRRMGSILIKDILIDLKKRNVKPEEKQIYLDFLSLLDYILEIFMVRYKSKQNADIDYDLIHIENKTVNDFQRYNDKLQYKLRQVDSI